MHKNHEVFIKALENKKRIELTRRKKNLEVISLCAPLHHSKGPDKPAKRAENELECYYLWDFGAKNGRNFLALSPSEIVSIKLTEEDFNIEDFCDLSKSGQNL